MSVSLSPAHSFSKARVPSIRLLAGLGVEGDAHCGTTVQHRSRIKKNPTQPNLRQVHILPCELFADLAAKDIHVEAGDIGENITTRGLNLLRLPRDSLLHIGTSAIVRVTGLRNPCGQLDEFRPGLFNAVIERLPDNTRLLRAGVMGVVMADGEVRPGDAVRVVLPATPFLPLDIV
jgi:MOSC domain-containing protein YiiM